MMKSSVCLLLGVLLLVSWSNADCPDGFELIRHRECQDINECSASSERRCDQLCANEPGTFRCGCLSGYLLGSDNTSCLADGPDPVIYFRRRKDIAMIDPSGLHQEVAIRRLGSIRSFDVHYETGNLYWIDGRGPSIGMTPLEQKGQVEVFNLDNLMKPEMLKIDWTSGMLYWTDSKTKTISRCTLNGTEQETILLSQKRPKALVLDPVETFIFWSTSGKYGRIFRADFDGRTRDVVIKSDLGIAVSIDVDIIDKRLYWLDQRRGVIESANYQGKDRMIVVEGIRTEETGLSLLADSIYWLESDPPAIHRADRRTGRRQIRIRSNFLAGQSSLIVMHENKQPASQEFYNGDHCTTWNNCYQFPHENRVPRNAKFVLFTTNDTIRKINQDGSNYAYVLDNENVRNLVGVDYDVRSEKIYFADAGRSVIESINLDGSDRQVIVGQSRIRTVEGIALDWRHRKLYWTDSSLRQVASTSLFRGNFKVIADVGVRQPRGITVHTELNWVYWTDIAQDSPKIFASQLDGSYRRAVIDEGLYFPNDIAIDYARSKLVWVDYGLQVIEQSTLDGHDREVLYRIAESGHDNLQPHSVAVMDRFLWYTNWEDDMVVRIDTRDNDLLDIVGDDMWRPSGIKAVDPRKNRKSEAPNPCHVFNGLCDQICVWAAENQVVCSCEERYRLNELDHRSCILVNPCESGHHKCTGISICQSDKAGGYLCTCPSGLEYMGDQGCVDKDALDASVTERYPRVPPSAPETGKISSTAFLSTTDVAKSTGAKEPETTELVHETTAPESSSMAMIDEHLGRRCPASHRAYCLNGGECRWLVDLKSASCMCNSNFIGERCELSSVHASIFNNPVAVAVSGGVILPLFCIITLLLVCFICRSSAKSKASAADQNAAVFYRRSSSYHQREGGVVPVFRPSQDNIQMETIDRTSFAPVDVEPTEPQFSTFPRRAPCSSKNNNNSTDVDALSRDQTCDVDDDVQVPGDYEDMTQDTCSSYMSMTAPRDHGYMSTIERHYTNTVV